MQISMWFNTEKKDTNKNDISCAENPDELKNQYSLMKR